MNIRDRIHALRIAEAGVRRLERAVRRYRLTVRSFRENRDGVTLVLARRGSGARGGKLRGRRDWYLPRPYNTDQYQRLAALPGE